MSRKLWAGVALILMGICVMAGGWRLAGTTAVAAGGAPDWAAEVIRLHVVANSDSDEDQALKRDVRDAILAEVTPLFQAAQSVADAEAAIATASPRIEQVAAAVVSARGKAYPVRAELGRFAFPAKSYGAFFLPAGDYKALRVTIGSAEGANWWCVLFPPLCFADWTSGVVLEPKPGSGGAETVAVPRKRVAALVDDEQVAQMPIRPRSAVLSWLKSKLGGESKAGRQLHAPVRIPLP
jgi:stage II sporulation protein R